VLAYSLLKDRKRTRMAYAGQESIDSHISKRSGGVIEARPLLKLPRGVPSSGGEFSDVEMDWIRRIAGSRLRLGASSVPCTMPWLVSSLCPLIFGNELVKLGLILALFGGTQSATRYLDSMELPRSSSSSGGGVMGSAEAMEADGYAFSTRSDIHVLIVGDPGLGKSQLLRAAAAVAPKAVFVCANTATTAGLTVSLSRDGGSSGRSGGGGGGGRDVCIEAGALVLADRGVCCIDEIDKMTCDPHSMLEAMEQQQISVAKSGMVTSLKSRTTILAAANPVGGHYTRNKSVRAYLFLRPTRVLTV
jgi:DNA helicase MCM8